MLSDCRPEVEFYNAIFAYAHAHQTRSKTQDLNTANSTFRNLKILIN